MLLKMSVFSRSLRNILQGTQRRQVHYQIGKDGQKIVVSHRHHVRSKREEWQNVSAMGYEKELRQINKIERDERLQSDPKQAKMVALNKMTQLRDRLLTAGFCRDRKSYTPPKDVETKLNALFQAVFNTTDESFELGDPEKKFRILIECANEFDHEVSNSSLYQIKTLADVKEFYQTPVRGVNSYDNMVNQADNLPKNLHVIPDAIRFDPQTDTMFDGIDAFPGSSRQLVGLRAKKRYPTKTLEFQWPDI